ncbi:MAG: type I restriction-modification system subunit M, partial [Rhodococcus sp. (in: high G+C Gram-positive bacteria)]|nr:type I restriction-modification system subunit M [Rhodococcus sp. (in: high G+C Gram-positive bacteria)]
RENLTEYVTSFSANIDVFEQFGLEQVISTLDENNRLYLVVEKFAGVNLHPEAISNAEMGDLYEHLIYKFAEASNEEAGEHYTPRDAIRLMVDLLFAEEQESLLGEGVVRTVYDPTAGTGGMLSVAEERLHERNPNARLTLYGQEINGQSYAICKSDMISKGQDIGNIRRGDTLIEDHFYRRTFDFCLSNPPYGVDWKAAESIVKEEHRTGGLGRFNAGLPKIDDGQMLFLQHLVSKMRPAHQGGGRAGIVLNGSPLFTGAAESGPSKIRQWLLESDLVDAIIALPTDMFFNTGIATYIWVLDNTKKPERQGTVQLVDATGMGVKMRKKLGDKSKEIPVAQRDEVISLYDAHEDGDNSKILSTDEFGYWAITVERPFVDDDGEVVLDRKRNPKPDSKKRETENVPFTYGGNAAGADGKDATIEAYFTAEVAPYVPDAWVDVKKTKVGYEIPFTRIFYKYFPPRPLEEIDRDLEAKVAKILTMLKAVEASLAVIELRAHCPA